MNLSEIESAIRASKTKPIALFINKADLDAKAINNLEKQTNYEGITIIDLPYLSKPYVCFKEQGLAEPLLTAFFKNKESIEQPVNCYSRKIDFVYDAHKRTFYDNTFPLMDYSVTEGFDSYELSIERCNAIQNNGDSGLAWHASIIKKQDEIWQKVLIYDKGKLLCHLQYKLTPQEYYTLQCGEMAEAETLQLTYDTKDRFINFITENSVLVLPMHDNAPLNNTAVPLNYDDNPNTTLVELYRSWSDTAFGKIDSKKDEYVVLEDDDKLNLLLLRSLRATANGWTVGNLLIEKHQERVIQEESAEEQNNEATFLKMTLTTNVSKPSLFSFLKGKKES